MSKSWSHRADLFRTSFSLVECDLFQSRGRTRRFLNWQERPSPNSNYTEYSCRLFADTHFLTGWDVAFLRSAYHIPLTRCTLQSVEVCRHAASRPKCRDCHSCNPHQI